MQDLLRARRILPSAISVSESPFHCATSYARLSRQPQPLCMPILYIVQAQKSTLFFTRLQPGRILDLLPLRLPLPYYTYIIHQTYTKGNTFMCPNSCDFLGYFYLLFSRVLLCQTTQRNSKNTLPNNLEILELGF